MRVPEQDKKGSRGRGRAITTCNTKGAAEPGTHRHLKGSPRARARDIWREMEQDTGDQRPKGPKSWVKISQKEGHQAK